MKNLKLFCVAVVVAVCACMAPSAQAVGPFKFGIKAGMTVNSLKFNKSLLDADNRSGFTVGGMVQFGTPLGFGVDGSVMFTRRSSEWPVSNGKEEYITNFNRNYIEIPINLRWNFTIPVISRIVTPYLATGPDFSFLCSKKNFNDAVKSRTVDVAWNFGFGLQFVKHVEIGASYGLGITKSASGDESLYGGPFNGKNRFWTVTAAYLF